MLLLCEKAALKRYFRLTLLHFSPFTEFTPLTERFELFAEHFMPFRWHFRTFYRASTTFTEPSRLLLNFRALY
jgi:hypothetical protein